jgi:uncharacterized protein YegP (UPF0339 family)
MYGMAGDARFAVYRSKDGQFYFLFRAANGQVLVTSETYTTKQSALNGIEALRASISGAGVVDMTDE